MTETATETGVPQYSKKDFVSDQTVRWCPGCGDYAILTAMQNAMTEIGRRKEDIVFVSGIGCSSRFPYYLDTYGFHGIHGRAPAIASGTKIANPNLDVWVISGDGDSLSIGGNHFIHSLRRNIGIKYIIFNNEIYGLTKGQYSPTSRLGTVAKSTPYGSVDRAFCPGSLAIGAEATLFARVPDTSPKEMKELFIAVAKHKGNALVEVLQNCVIYNDNVFEDITARETRAAHQIFLKHGQPMLFGEKKEKGIVFDKGVLKVVTVGQEGYTEKDVLVHDAHDANPFVHFMLTRMRLPEFPVAMGIIRQVEEPTYEEQVHKQIDTVTAQKGRGKLQDLLTGPETWEVK